MSRTTSSARDRQSEANSLRAVVPNPDRGKLRATSLRSEPLESSSHASDGNRRRQSENSPIIKNIELDTLFQTLIVAEQGSFHKAASVLGVKTSTLSRRMQELEIQIGVSLFQRHRHGVRPTDAGKSFLENMQRIESDLGSVLVNARAAGRGESGWLRIGIYASLSAGPLRDALLTYARRFPDVEMSIFDESRRSLMERLNRGGLDIIIINGQVRHGG